MEQELLSPANGDLLFPSLSVNPPFRGLSSPQYFNSTDDYSIFSPKGSISPVSSFSPEQEDLTSTENCLYLAGLRLQCQDFANRSQLCLSHLDDVAQEAEALRLENAQLRILNGDLTKRLTGRMTSSAFDAMSSFADEFRKLRIENPTPAVESPTSVLAQQKASLPKSISVRSTGYKKQNPEGLCDRNGRTKVSKPVMSASQHQRVYVGGGNKKSPAEVAALELEVYNQGMFKTELCNKWQETGKCPYGDHCQFAHGIGELRPVIRHPRYKTEACRMVLAGDSCPYGHRCHFRHALSPSDHHCPT